MNGDGPWPTDSAEPARRRFGAAISADLRDEAFRALNGRLERFGLSLRMGLALQFQDDRDLEAAVRRDPAVLPTIAGHLEDGTGLLEDFQEVMAIGTARVAVIAARLGED